MAMENPVNFPSAVAGGAYDETELDIDVLLSEHQQQPVDRSREFSLINRSGSAPPTVEGSMAAMRGAAEGLGGGVLSDEEMRLHSAYLAFYYSNENTNPRLPPPAVSREDWRSTRRYRSGTASSLGGIGDQRRKGMDRGGDVGSMWPFSVAPGAMAMENGDLLGGRQQGMVRRDSGNWGKDGLTGLQGIGLGTRKKSSGDVLQDDISRPSRLISHPSLPVNRNDAGILNSQLIHPEGSHGSAGNHSGVASPSLSRVRSVGSSVSHSLASVQSIPILRSRTPDPKLIQRIPSPGLPPISARVNMSSDVPSHMIDDRDIAAALSGMDLANMRYVSGEGFESQLHIKDAEKNEFLLNLPGGWNQFSHQNVGERMVGALDMPLIQTAAYDDLMMKNGPYDSSASKLSANGQENLARDLSLGGIGAKIPPLGSSNLERSSGLYNKAEFSNINIAGSDLVGLSPNQTSLERLHTYFGAGSGLEGHYLDRNGSQTASSPTPLYAQYLQRAGLAASSASSLNNVSPGGNISEASLLDPGYQKAYLEAILAQKKLQLDLPSLGNSAGMDHGLYGNSVYGLGLPVSTSHLSSSFLSSLGAASLLRQSEWLPQFSSVGRNTSSGNFGLWGSENGIKETGFSSSFLEEFKNNKSRSFELSDIVHHVVEFSADQYGSRFIQQKLETASVEEKNMIFPEILSHARPLMTDVFGNYVIQKFFEHGTQSQRMQLASQLTGHVLPLSLQMYGCRVIQKALEVVGVDQQTQMVSELDGSVMKCVRDQNGNHVIQKCIECVPQEKIQFIISTFYGQVATLSSHPYGCRVIQRVLEHCDDAKTQSTMMEEILKSVSALAQDQYGNYVVQHVLQHGKPEERSAIIGTLAGQIVKMSQQKFASNVVEKCLTYGSLDERQLLINEMLGSTDENEPLQAMMKDQFGNYVVQKVLETCDDRNRELILSRIKVHLNALKKYTYGKHIVARVEKLVAAGERCVGTPSLSS